jgi:hypothetical protein
MEPFERGAIAQVVLERNTGIVDEDVQSVDFLDGRPDLRRIGDVQRQGRDPTVGVDKGLARAGIRFAPLRASSEPSRGRDLLRSPEPLNLRFSLHLLSVGNRG